MSTRPPSEARIAANKANAQKSTGPRTAEGKAAVANNAMKHGLRSERNPLDLSEDAALPSEREEFVETLTGYTASLNPVGLLEIQLVERLAQLNLRLNRALRMETTHLLANSNATISELTAAGSTIATDTGGTRDNGLVMLAFLRDPNALTLIGRYESRLSRDFARTLAQFHQLQKLRKQTQLPSEGIMPTLSVASDGHLATTEIPAEQTQPPAQEIPTRSHVSHNVGANNGASGPQLSSEQTQPTPEALQTTHPPETIAA